MKKILFVNSCIREEDSRTLRIARSILQSIEKEVVIEEINLNKLPLIPYNNASFNDMSRCGPNPLYVDIAHKVADCDILFIATPFWDMGIPGLLKTFLEKLSLNEITFKDNGNTCVGICKCEHIFYVTTRGMDIPDGSELEQASPYLKAVGHLWGIEKLSMVSAWNMDYISEEEQEEKIKAASKRGQELIRGLL